MITLIELIFWAKVSGILGILVIMFYVLYGFLKRRGD